MTTTYARMFQKRYTTVAATTGSITLNAGELMLDLTTGELFCPTVDGNAFNNEKPFRRNGMLASPSAVADNEIPRWDGTDGYTTQTSGVKILDGSAGSLNPTGSKTLTWTAAITLAGTDGKTLTINDNATITTFGATLTGAADAAAGRTALGLGTLATQNGTFSGTSSGTNTGDQTITLTGDVTGSGTGSFVATISNGAVTLAKMADMATGSLIYRKTAGTGPPEVNTLATLKTDLGLTGTNSGDQTITLTGDVTGSGTGSFAATIANGAVTFAKIAQGGATGSQVIQWNGSAWSAGTVVTSVGLSLPAELTVTGSPVTSTGTLTATWASQTANRLFAAPDGSNGTPSFRDQTILDNPALFTYFFGDGSDGPITITTSTATSGPLSSGGLIRDAHWTDCTINASGKIAPAGYRIRCRGTLDLTAAPAQAITGQGNNGGNSSGAGAGASSSASTGVLIGGGHTGTAGAAGGTGVGAKATTAAASQADFTNLGGSGAAGGTSGTNAGGTLTASTNSSPAGPTLKSLMDNFIRGVTLVAGGCGGTGGSAGGGDGTGSGGGGGGGGESGRMVVVYAYKINRGGSTAAGAIQSKGGTGGNGGPGTGGTNRGGGGGGGGGTGGVVWVAYSKLVGSTATNMIDVSGGKGGDGGAGTGTGIGGNGGNGGAGGRVYLCQIDLVGAGAWSITLGTSPGTTGGTGSGVTAGTGGAGVTTQVSL